MSKPNLFLPTLAMLISMGVLCALGFWQLHRLQWKIDLAEQIEAEFSKDISTLSLRPADIEGDYNFKRGALEGTYDFDTQIFVAPRVYKNLPGKHVYTLLRLNDGSHILVNRGWVPIDWTFDHEDPRTRTALQSRTVAGTLRFSERNPFTPDNRPEKNQWYFAEPARLAQIHNIPDMHERVLMLDNSGPEGDYPIPQGGPPPLKNHHLQYAIFWFVMAGILFIIYTLRFLRK